MAMIGVVTIVESKSARLLGITDETTCPETFGMSVLRCHPLAAATAGTIQELVPRLVLVAGATKPLQRLVHHERCSSLHLDHARRIPTMED